MDHLVLQTRAVVAEEADLIPLKMPEAAVVEEVVLSLSTTERKMTS
jgi:hypothetical protein